MSWRDTLRLQWVVTVPAWLWGVVAPRRRFVPLLARRDAAAAAARLLDELRQRYGSARLWTWFPFRRTLLVFDSDGIDAVLAAEHNFGDPLLKRLSLSRFVPDALVISAGEAWSVRRYFNEQVLATGRPHDDRDAFARIVVREVDRLVLAPGGEMRWSDFESLAARISQQIVFGTDQVEPAFSSALACLVSRANLPLRHRRAFAAFYASIDRQLRRFGAGAHGAAAAQTSPCLARRAAASPTAFAPAAPTAAPIRVPAQLGFWIFVLDDALQLHVARTLALIAAHKPVQQRLRSEIAGAGVLTTAVIDGLQFLDACIAEQLRLWTPVPLLLRRAVEPFALRDGTTIQAGQQILCHAGFVHRDARVFGARAHSFAPEAPGAGSELFVFSRHRQACAGETLVRFVLKATLAALLARFRVELVGPPIDPDRIAAQIDHFGLTLRLHAEPPAPLR